MLLVAQNNPIRALRRICGLTQAELADLLGCARLSIHAIESGRLKLSRKMAERIALHSGVSQHWLLDPKRKLPPFCEREPQRSFTLAVFKMTRAEISDPRIEALDVVAIEGMVAAAYRRLCDASWQAYRTGKIVYYNYLVREFLKDLQNHWKESRKMPQSSKVSELYAAFHSLMEKTRKEKAEKIRGHK